MAIIISFFRLREEIHKGLVLDSGHVNFGKLFCNSSPLKLVHIKREKLDREIDRWIDRFIDR